MKVIAMDSFVANHEGVTYSGIPREEMDLPKELAEDLIKAKLAEKKSRGSSKSETSESEE